MYPILILRTEIICLIILVLMLITARRYNLGKHNNTYVLLIVFALLHVIFDIVTVITVNNVDVVPSIVNKTLHLLFYITAMTFSVIFLKYVYNICYPNKKFNATFLLAFIGIYFIASYVVPIFVPELDIQYGDASVIILSGTNSSYGAPAYVGFGFAFINFLAAIIITIINKNKLTINIVNTLLPITIIAIALLAFQVAVREFLITGACATMITVGFFISNENPNEVFLQRDKSEALSKIKTLKEFNDDLDTYSAEFRLNKDDKYAFVRFFINGLADVNKDYGHDVGDDYISVVVDDAAKCFQTAIATYRLSGCEFISIFRGYEEEVIQNYIKSFEASVKISGASLPYNPDVVLGYAMSTETHNDLNEVFKATDYSLFRNKEAKRSGKDITDGVSINMTGLSNFMFDTQSIGELENYPYMINLNTNVGRIASGWKERFALPNEITYDFSTLWVNRIHPDDKEAFVNSFTCAVNGTKKYHWVDYRALDKNGDYIKCSCRGQLLTDPDGNPIFSGHMFTSGKAGE